MYSLFVVVTLILLFFLALIGLFMLTSVLGPKKNEKVKRRKK